MARPRFASVRNLFSGTALASPPEDEHEDDDATAAAGARGPTAAAIDAAMATEVDKAVAAANQRWNTVMTSDAGAGNPKAAARILSSSNMSAEDIVATLGDLAPAASASDTEASEVRAARLARDRAALANDVGADPNTGPAGGGPAARTGQGEAESAQKVRDERKARQDAKNKSALAKGGRAVNAAG